MSKSSRPVLILLLAVLSVFVVLKLALHMTVKYEVQTVGSQATGTKVRLGLANVSLLSGIGDLRRLTMENPEGFEMERAFDLPRVTVRMDVSSLLADTVVIHEIIIDAPELSYEIQGGTSNIKTILDTVRTHIRESGGEEKGPEENRGEGRRLRIDNVIIRDGTVTLSAPELRGMRAVVPLPNIYLADIGSEGEGVPPEEAMERVLAEANRSIGRALSDPTTAPGAAFDKAVFRIKGLFD
jgi:hypothetical protein